MKKMFFFIVTIVAMVVLAMVAINQVSQKKSAEKAGMENPELCKNEDSDWVKIPQGFQKNKKTGVCEETPKSTTAPLQKLEGLVLQHQCLTPCSSYIGWDYRIWTEEHPVQVRNENYRWDFPAVGVSNPPKNFKPGEAEIISLEKNNPHVNVWVYKKEKNG